MQRWRVSVADEGLKKGNIVVREKSFSLEKRLKSKGLITI